jgi:hypothetical protein
MRWNISLFDGSYPMWSSYQRKETLSWQLNAWYKWGSRDYDEVRAFQALFLEEAEQGNYLNRLPETCIV